MTITEAQEMADEQITYWQTRGVTVVMVGGLFRCHRKWDAVRERMIGWLMSEFDEPSVEWRRAA